MRPNDSRPRAAWSQHAGAACWQHEGLNLWKEGPVRSRLSTAAAAAAEEELRSLHAWLLADSQARRHANVRWDAASQMPDGGMGTWLDIVSLVIGSGFSAASLAVSVTQ
ncbi:effector-associated constant component EACC1 [Streptomyces chartreusis]|uniref:effector-associated constant component EACC1 n=1 Tax=Streptomyces chartreusis TaxID=1969 RepID=UPI0033A85FE7